MAKIHFTNSNAGRWLCCLAGLTLFVGHAQGQEYDPDWTRNFRIGALVGLNISANFNMKGPFNISKNRPPGVYDDGYVRVDQTGNAQGYTSYWGYNDANQYKPATQTLLMHSGTSFTPTGPTSSSKGDEAFVGFDLAYGGNIHRWNRVRLGWELGFGLLPIKITDNQPIAGNLNRSVYSFDTGGIVVPTAPYNGGPSGIGPTIHDHATQLADEPGLPATITGSRTLDVNLYLVRLGPTMFWDVNRYVGLEVGVGPALGIVSGNLKFDETITTLDGGTTHNKGQIGGTELTFGGYVNSTVTFHMVKNGDFYLGVQFIPMNSTTISGQGREARLNLGGQVYLSAGINWPF
jgi:hypothetical protein